MRNIGFWNISKQLHYIPVTAFSCTDLFINRISLEWDSHDSARTNHKKLINVIGHWTGTAFVSQKERRTENRSVCKNAVTYRIYSNKRRGALIFRDTSAALIRGWYVFEHRIRRIYFFLIFIQRYHFYLLILQWTDTKLKVNLGLREKFTGWKNPRVSW